MVITRSEANEIAGIVADLILVVGSMHESPWRARLVANVEKLEAVISHADLPGTQPRRLFEDAPRLRTFFAQSLAGLLHAINNRRLAPSRAELQAAAVLADETQQAILARAFRGLADDVEQIG